MTDFQFTSIQSPLVRLSQSQLNLLETCPPQFQRIHLEQMSTPINAQQQEKITWGSQFHRLMQQKELALPIDSLLQDNEELQKAIAALYQAAPELGQTSGKREAEHLRTLNFQGYLLTVVYDLLILAPNQGKILDWKTYLQPENPTLLRKNWQTRLYLYVLAETSDYLPEQLSMTYWFVKLPTQPQSVTFTYSRQQHEQTRQDLSQLLTRLDEWLSAYLHKNLDFPHHQECQSCCPYYPSMISLKDSTQTPGLTLIDDIEEIPL